MRKQHLISFNILLFVLASLLIVNCVSRTDGKMENGYVNEIDTLFEENTTNIIAIGRTFYRKQATIHNGLLEFKQPDGEKYIIVVVKEKESDEFSLFVIEDFNEFIEKTKVVMNNSSKDYTVSIDDLESTFMRKSLSFDKGVFIRKEANNTPSTIFDLSEKDINEIDAAYNSFLNE
ncbi:hypothetical protein [Bizionia arctica]|uniref:Uncharacterized protein n=1 Tax=Bizionia arctica TaxID=1495645 RepID=A0A917GSA8_9FLAO|nr:hypothetical protein [Bizionia arctica]GGG54951.1 hypothetical protein GCM10010976_27350 [Bizionia arctica]